MRVLHVAPYYPPRPGGVGVFTARLHRALREAGCASRVWTRGATDAQDPGDAVERIARSRAGWLAALTRRAPQAASFDLVHVHAGEALPLLAALRLAPRRPRIVATWHVHYAGMARALAPADGSGSARALLERSLGAWAHRAADRAALPLVDAAVPVSRACAVELLGARRGAAAEVIPPGVGEPDAPRAGDLLSPAELLYVGDAGPRKRARALPELLARVRAARPATRLRIVGIEPAAAPALRRAFAARGVADAVAWAGRLGEQDVAACYRAARLLVVPSAYEGLPLVVVEALRAGLPVVATRVGALAEAVDEGESGYLVPADDVAALAGRCVALLRDEARRTRFARRAAAVARERFGFGRHVRAYRALYARLLASAA